MTTRRAPTSRHTHGPLRVLSTVTGPIQENAVLVLDAAGEGFIIDPGDDAGTLLDLIRAEGARPAAILLTHGHFDHIGAVQALREALDLPVYLHPLDLPLYRAGASSAARWNLPFRQPDEPEYEIENGQKFQAGDVWLTARHLPGHAPGHVVFVGGGFVIAGDTLFKGSIGRTDLPGGDHPALIAGITRELLSLPPKTTVYAGHGEPTSVEREARSNPHLTRA